MLLALILTAYLPLVFFLPLPISILFFSIVGTAVGAKRLSSSLRNTIKYLLLGLSLSSILLLYGVKVMGRDAGASFLCLMIGIKIWEIKDSRDKNILLSLSNFIALSAALFSQSLWLGIYLFFYVILFLIILRLEFFCEFSPNKARLSPSILLSCLFIFLQAIPLALVLFVFFPRLPGAVFGIKGRGNRAVSGLSSVIKGGDFSSLSLSNKVAFRVKFQDKMPPSLVKHLYWRCLVFYRERHGVWTCVRERQRDKDYGRIVVCKGQPLTYRVFLSPQGNRFLPFLDGGHIFSLPPGVQLEMNQGYFYTLAHRVPFPIQYQGEGCVRYIMKGNLRDIELGLRVDRAQNPRSQKLVLSLVKNATSAVEVVRRLIYFFSRGDFVYTLYPPIWPGKNSLDFFLFHSKKGFCEHYAMAMVMLLRYAHIPSRIVAGYVGGEINPVGNYVIVKFRNAHAWVEAYLGQKRGWVRIDPTRYLSHRRVMEEIEQERARGHYFYVSPDIVIPLRFLWDYLTYQWMRWMVSYNQEEQLFFLKNLHLGNGITQIFERSVILIVIGFFITLGGIFALSIKGDKGETEIREYYRKFLRKIEKKGVGVNLTMGPLEVMEEIEKALPHISPRAKEIISLFVEMVFAGEDSPDKVEKFKKKIRSL